MLFTNLGRVVAFVIILFGLFKVVIGWSVASGAVVEPEPGAYLGSSTSGQMIDHGIYTVLLAIALGTLTEISRSVAKSAAGRTMQL